MNSSWQPCLEFHPRTHTDNFYYGSSQIWFRECEISASTLNDSTRRNALLKDVKIKIKNFKILKF
jgi:hypothetical protein